MICLKKQPLIKLCKENYIYKFTRKKNMTKEVPKFGEQEVLQFVGLRDLSPEEQDTVNRLSTEYYEKVKRAAKNLTNVKVHIKCYQKEGAKKKFSVHIHVSIPSHAIIESCKSHDFELAKSIHSAFQDVQEQMRKKLRTDEQRPKSY